MTTKNKIPLSEEDVSNVYIYVGDAVRWDFLPKRISDIGLTAKTIASSIHSPTSFASIFSGQYLPQHQIEYFDNQVSAGSPHLFRSAPESFYTGFANTINEKFVTSDSSVIDKTLRLNKVNHSVIGEIKSPFIFVERGPGGHAPYGDYSLTGSEYFEQTVYDSIEEYKSDYQKSIQMDIDHFFGQIQTLKERGIAEDTLIIYTSDHGELLGECGTLGHNSLIHPLLVYVPTVFIHPSIEGNSHIENKVFRHVDLLPTIFSLLALNIPDGVVGENVTDAGFSYSGSSFYNTDLNLFSRTFDSHYASTWDHHGGYLYRKTSIIGSFLNLLKHYKGNKGAFMRKKPHKNLPFFLRRKKIFGSPQIGEKQAKERIRQYQMGGAEEKVGVIDVNKDVLRDLGYLD